MIHATMFQGTLRAREMGVMVFQIDYQNDQTGVQDPLHAKGILVLVGSV